MINLTVIAAIVWLFLSTQYIFDTLRGQTKPNKMTWFIWALAPMIGTFSSLKNGFNVTEIPVFISGLIPFLIFLASFFNQNSYYKVSKLDIVCGLISLLALIGAFLTVNLLLVTFLAVISDFLAAIPTIIKSWTYPSSENIYFYFGGLLTSIVSFTGINFTEITNFIFPIYLVMLNLTIVLIISIRKMNKGKQLL